MGARATAGISCPSRKVPPSLPTGTVKGRAALAVVLCYLLVGQVFILDSYPFLPMYLRDRES